MTPRPGPWKRTRHGIPKQDPTLAGRPLRFSASEEALLPLHPGQGVRDYRHPEGGSAEGLSGLRVHRSPGQGRHRTVCHGLDPAYRGGAEHPGHVALSRASWETWGSPAAGSMPCAGNPMSRVPPTRPLLFHILPGYLPNPRAQWATLADYNKTTPSFQRPPERQLVEEPAQVCGQPFKDPCTGRKPPKRMTSVTAGCPSWSPPRTPPG